MSSRDNERGSGSGMPQSFDTTILAVLDERATTEEAPATSTSFITGIENDNSNVAEPSLLQRPISKSSTSDGRVYFLGATEDLRPGDGPDDENLGNSDKSLSIPAANSANEAVYFTASSCSTRSASTNAESDDAILENTDTIHGDASSVHDLPRGGSSTRGIRDLGSLPNVGLEGAESDSRRSIHPSPSAASVAGEKSERFGGDDSVTAGTFRYQSRLPKLQIPPLEETLSRFLLTAQPLLSPEAFSKTKAVVEEFKIGDGQVLQQALIQYSADKDSYLEEFWDDSYLTPNSSTVLNLNPFFVFETPTLSAHTKDWGDDVKNTGSSAASRNGQPCTTFDIGHGRPAYTSGSGSLRRGLGRGSPYVHQTHQRSRETDPTAMNVGYDGGIYVAAPEAGNKQARRAASLLYSSLRFVAAVKSDTLPPDVWRNTPLCMSQYRRLFGTHRKAVENNADEMKICEDSTHVVVLCGNQFYWFSPLHADGRVGVSEEELEDIMLGIQEDASKASLAERAALAVGVLTTETRDEWAVLRKQLASSGERNNENLNMVESALFVLCLDHTSPSTAAEIASACLHGSYALEGDIQVGTCTNRWYDKLQLIVFENGTAGVNFEHTWVDGHTVLRFASDVFADVIYRFANHITSSTGSGRDGLGTVFPPDERPFSPCVGRTPKKMAWRLSPELRRAIYFAETRISDLIRQHDVQALEYDTFGKRFITENKMSPDALVQMSIVFAYYALYGKVVAVHEPVLTKMFLKGRTEALRPVTAEVKDFLETFCDPETSSEQKMLSLRSAIASHSRLLKLAAKGKGFDRHLYALLCMAKRRMSEAAEANGGTNRGSYSRPRIPALFKDEAWRTLNHGVLSTSNCGNPSLRLFGSGPNVRDGFGVGYIIKENQLQLVATSKSRQTDRFVGKIKQFLDYVYETYIPDKIYSRVRLSSGVDTSGDTGPYSKWGSFASKGEVPRI